MDNEGTTVRRASRTVIGAFADAADARKALETLQLHGFDGGDVAIAGRRAERANADPERERPDQRAPDYVGRRVATTPGPAELTPHTCLGDGVAGPPAPA